MATYPNQAKKLLRVYPLAWLFAYLALSIVFILLSSISSNPASVDQVIPYFLALTFMFLLSAIVYFYVPLSTWLLLMLLHNFVMKDRGSKTKSALISTLLAAACWVVTFPVALAFVNMITAGNQFLQIQESSAPFLYLFGGSNLIGLIGAVLWIKLRPQKN